MSAATRIASKDLKLRIRDRSAFILGIIAPLALAIIFNVVFGNTFEAELDLRLGLVDLDQTEISQSFAQVLDSIQAEGLLSVTDFADTVSAEQAIEDGEIDAFYHIEPGLSEAVVVGEPVVIQVVGDIDAPTSTQIATSIADQYGRGISAVQLSVGTASTLSDPPPGPQQLAVWSQEAAGSGQSFMLNDLSTETRQLDTTTYFAAGMAVFFLFFTVQFGVIGLLEEEQDGTLARLFAAPITRASVVLGKAYLSFLLGVISMGILIIATSLGGGGEGILSFFFLGAEWGAPLGVALLVIAGVLSAVAIMGLVAAVAKTAEGAGNLGAIIAVTLGMLGGVFFPLGQGDDFLSKLTFVTPHAWFMRGLGDLSDGAPWTDALPATAAILIFAFVFGLFGWYLLHRRYRT